MQLNGIDLAGYSAEANKASFVLEGVTMQDALNLDGQTLTVTQDGTDYAIYAGYSVVEVKEQADGNITMTAMRKLGDQTAEAINGLDASVTLLTSKLGAVETSASDAAAKADEAKTAADEAKTAAEQAGTDPQLQALAKVQVATMDLSEATCDEVVAFRDYWPEWQPDTAYKHNQPLTYQGRYFRASKDLTSQAIYPPGTAESEYYEVELAEDGIIIWYKVGGEYNMVHKGEKRHYPDESGPVYEALENTSYSPDAYPQHWKKLED